MTSAAPERMSGTASSVAFSRHGPWTNACSPPSTLMLAPRGHRGDRVRAGLKVVPHHRVLGAAELGHAIDHEPLRADALDAGAHLSEQPAEVLHVRLAGRVEDLGPAFGAHGRQQDVLG